MAIREIRECDLTGEAEARAVQFSVDGRTWEIDLGDVGVKQLEEALRPFTDAGREVTFADAAADPGDPGPVAVSRATDLPAPALTAEERRHCRAWAQRFPKRAEATVGRTGAIPAAVVDRWIVAGKPVLS